MNKKIFIILFFFICLAGIFCWSLNNVVKAADLMTEDGALGRTNRISTVMKDWKEKYDEAVKLRDRAYAAASKMTAETPRTEMDRLNAAWFAAEDAVEGADSVKRQLQLAHSAADSAYIVRKTHPEISGLPATQYREMAIEAQTNADEAEEKAYKAMERELKALEGVDYAFNVSTPQEAQATYQLVSRMVYFEVMSEGNRIAELAENNYGMQKLAVGQYLEYLESLRQPGGTTGQPTSVGPYVLESGLPGLSDTADLGQFIRVLFVFGLSIVGILALISMVVGGVLWLSSAGNPNRISTAKSIIGGALTGLALLLCSYIILWLINPDLVKWNVKLETPQIQPPSTPSTP